MKVTFPTFRILRTLSHMVRGGAQVPNAPPTGAIETWGNFPGIVPEAIPRIRRYAASNPGTAQTSLAYSRSRRPFLPHYTHHPPNTSITTVHTSHGRGASTLWSSRRSLRERSRGRCRSPSATTASTSAHPHSEARAAQLRGAAWLSADTYWACTDPENAQVTGEARRLRLDRRGGC